MEAKATGARGGGVVVRLGCAGAVRGAGPGGVRGAASFWTRGGGRDRAGLCRADERASGRLAAVGADAGASGGPGGVVGGDSPDRKRRASVVLHAE